MWNFVPIHIYLYTYIYIYALDALDALGYILDALDYYIKFESCDWLIMVNGSDCLQIRGGGEGVTAYKG